MLNRILPPPRVLTPKAKVRCFGPSIMSGSSLQGQWMSSSVTEEDIKKLREARYLTAEVSHRLPTRGQVIPTPEPIESVVFISHFLRGLGLALDPFVKGLMFYYGWIFTIWPRIPFFTSRHLLSFVRPSSALPLTSACGSRPSM